MDLWILLILTRKSKVHWNTVIFRSGSSSVNVALACDSSLMTGKLLVNKKKLSSPHFENLLFGRLQVPLVRPGLILAYYLTGMHNLHEAHPNATVVDAAPSMNPQTSFPAFDL